MQDYFPYGASRVATATSTNEKRKYIGQFSDDSSGLDYLNARYYDSARGQFVTQDPVFWGNQNLTNPQSLNTYSYSSDNPITRKDPSGLQEVVTDTIGVSVLLARFGPVIVNLARAAVISGAISTDIGIASNISDNAISNGQLQFNARPGALISDFGKGAIVGVAGEVAAPARLVANPRLAALLKLAQKSASAGATQGLIDITNGQTDPSQVTTDVAATTISSFVVGRAVGSQIGRPVQSFSSSLLYGGRQTVQAGNGAIISQSLTSQYLTLQAAFNAYVASTKSPSAKSKSQ